MADEERRKRGMEMFEAVYGGVVPFPPEESHDDFIANNIDHLFAEVWSRPAMSILHRRLFIMGILCAQAEEATFELQVRASLHKGELKPSDVQELITILPYLVGYPRATRMRSVTQRVLAEIEKK